LESCRIQLHSGARNRAREGKDQVHLAHPTMPYLPHQCNRLQPAEAFLDPFPLRQLMTPDATYVSLNFDNPELKKVMPWAGTHKGPQALSDVFAAIQSFWKTLDFKVTDTIEQG
jgi:hypothetical protein